MSDFDNSQSHELQEELTEIKKDIHSLKVLVGVLVGICLLLLFPFFRELLMLAIVIFVAGWGILFLICGLLWLLMLPKRASSNRNSQDV